MAAKFKFKKSKNNHYPFPLETLNERYLKEKATNPKTQYTVEKSEDEYFIFKTVDSFKK
ncbi:hypothetical protein [Bacillus sp. V2I10]|uniref:hypothetical protein n=1 Tax=Bacillus sp. V2I10 TaxID=3042276 RepID=UPI00278A9934|nr:hypothetical protein [Bacillus sp. V2I10]MDQ0859853.1 uncharacterized protein YegP (UPF0339 family) [Bacillus sp. V2I10]